MELGRVVCGVDASEASLEAARQAARLAPPSARLLVVTVAEVDVAVHAGFLAVRAADDLEREAEAALARVRAELLDVHPVETCFLRGRDPAGTLLRVARDGATLLCVGTHGWGRARGKALGRVSTRLLHEAPCSVLVARPARSAAAFPSGIAVGLDGSQEAEAAAEVAVSLRERFDVPLRWIAASASKGIDLDAIRAGLPELETPAEKAVDALVAASADVDVLVVGSRGLHGMRALGSVSERVAHQARCSVLVVRSDGAP